MSAQILVTKPGVLTVKDRATLRRAGVVCVEADNPADVKLISAEGAELGATELLYAAMKGVNAEGYNSNSGAFARAVEAALALQFKQRAAEQ